MLLSVGLLAGSAGGAGCYQKVVRADGPLAQEYTVYESDQESGLLGPSKDKKDEPERVRPRSKGIQ
ncbi:MAG TPA: hypothetical protein DEB06_03250 [Phycisphaerales bacterium]|nr:hypothetical protein [Phycisphaerales bacterium]